MDDVNLKRNSGGISRAEFIAPEYAGEVGRDFWARTLAWGTRSGLAGVAVTSSVSGPRGGDAGETRGAAAGRLSFAHRASFAHALEAESYDAWLERSRTGSIGRVT